MTITGLLNVLAVNPRPPIAHRARVHVAARRPRVQVSRAEQEAVVERFLAAVRNGDLQGLLDVLAPDVVVVSDGGGMVAAARRPIEGANRVAPVLGSLARLAGDFEVMPIWLTAGWRSDLHRPQPAEARPTRRGGVAQPLADPPVSP